MPRASFLGQLLELLQPRLPVSRERILEADDGASTLAASPVSRAGRSTTNAPPPPREMKRKPGNEGSRIRVLPRVIETETCRVWGYKVTWGASEFLQDRGRCGAS